MRLDKFLQVSGLIKRRNVAKEACRRGLIRINGISGKPTKTVVVGDDLLIDLPTREIKVKILREIVGNSLPKMKRSEFFTIISDLRRQPPPCTPNWDDGNDSDNRDDGSDGGDNDDDDDGNDDNDGDGHGDGHDDEKMSG